ncbi:IQ domain-containing protein E-like [Chanos chanos]|uniref:IQ domain-containing protein E-like n=1 Tax=Chanos chanos TaxID=29144 RepID=A0A6J2VPN4_CHACN|nr:IQ domain-containing protein E-like [Chanos chanos]
MSVEASEFVSDEDMDELGEDVFSHVTYASDSEKKIKKKKTSSKPPHSPRSPYLCSANLNPGKTTWPTVKGTVLGESSKARIPRDVWLASLRNGHGLVLFS